MSLNPSTRSSRASPRTRTRSTRELSPRNPVQQTPARPVGALRLRRRRPAAARPAASASRTAASIGPQPAGRAPRADPRRPAAAGHPQHPQPRPARPHPHPRDWCRRCSRPGCDRAARAPACRRWSTTRSTPSSRAATAMDVIADLAFPLPFQVISDMLGMPASEETQLRDWAHTLTLGLEPLLALQHLRRDPRRVRPHDRARARRHRVEAGASGRRPAHRRSSPPRTTATASPPDELVDQVILLYVAGHETTVNLIGNGTLRAARATARSSNGGATTRRSTPTRSTSCCATTAPVQFSRRVTTPTLDVGDAHHRARACSCSRAWRRPTATRPSWGTTPQALDLDAAGRGAAPRVRVGHPPLPGRGAGPARGPHRPRHADPARSRAWSWPPTPRRGTAASSSGASTPCPVAATRPAPGARAGIVAGATRL